MDEPAHPGVRRIAPYLPGVPRSRLFLFDGYALAWRAWHALAGRPLRTTRGEDTTVPFGVIRVVRKLLVEQRPAYAAFVLDGPGGDAPRRARFPAYKAGRPRLPGSEADRFEQGMGRLRALLAAFRIPVIQVPGAEADDVIATLARKAVAAGLEAVVVSGDTDFFQMVGPHVRVYEPGRGGRARIKAGWVDEAEVMRRAGVAPRRIVDFLALAGDPSDAIPGVAGIGARTAATLLERYETLDGLLAHLPEVTPARVRQALEARTEEVRLYRELVTLRTDLPVPLDLDALRVRAPDLPRLRRLYRDLEFRSLLREFEREEGRAQGRLPL